MLLGAPATMMAQIEAESIESSLADASLQVVGNKIRISGANNQVLEIFNLTGVKVSTIRIDSNEKVVNLNLPKGCYLMKVDKIVRKISIR